MTIARQIVAEKLEAYLRHEIPLLGLVEWAETALREGKFSEVGRLSPVRHALERLTLEQVRILGLPAEECDDLIHALRRPQRITVPLCD